jgi:hypothetical protein
MNFEKRKELANDVIEILKADENFNIFNINLFAKDNLVRIYFSSASENPKPYINFRITDGKPSSYISGTGFLSNEKKEKFQAALVHAEQVWIPVSKL